MKIIVGTEEAKKQLIKESEYIHDFQVATNKSKNKSEWIGLDSAKASILMHIHINPDMIIVEKNIEENE